MPSRQTARAWHMRPEFWSKPGGKHHSPFTLISLCPLRGPTAALGPQVSSLESSGFLTENNFFLRAKIFLLIGNWTFPHRKVPISSLETLNLPAAPPTPVSLFASISVSRPNPARDNPSHRSV